MVAVVKRLTRATVTRIFEGSIPSSHPNLILAMNRLHYSNRFFRVRYEVFVHTEEPVFYFHSC